jgi:hypothetical protein
MKINRILTDRDFQNWPSWHIVYEWENELSNALNIPLKNSLQVKSNFIYKKFKHIDNKFFKGKLDFFLTTHLITRAKFSLYFEMSIQNHKKFSNSRIVIPVIVDFWEKTNIEHFKRIYAECPLLLITSLEVLNFLKENHIKNKLIHFPMSLPSNYKLMPDQIFKKEYDIVLAGRKNLVLWDYLKQYEKLHPEVEYLHQIEYDGELYYESNKRGIIGNFHTRSEYMNLIKLAKVAFYSTPGIDGGENRTNGFNPVTPRFFELLSAGCHIISRYSKNIETDYYKFETICSSVTSYADFENQLNIALISNPPIKKNAEYLNNHYTSSQIEILKNL